MEDIFSASREGNFRFVKTWLENTSNDLNQGWADYNIENNVTSVLVKNYKEWLEAKILNFRNSRYSFAIQLDFMMRTQCNQLVGFTQVFQHIEL